MMKKTIFSFLLTGLVFSFVSCKKEGIVPTVSNTEKATSVLTALQTQNTEAFTNYVSATNYTQHNLGFPDGRQPLIEAINAGQLAGTTVDIIRTFEEGDMVVLQSKYFLFGHNQVGFDVFRFENGLIVEHWDNLQALSSPETDAVNGNTQLNGTTTTANSTETAASKTLVTNMVNNVLIAGQWSNRVNYFAGTYIQHSPGIPNGTDWMAGFAEGTPFFKSLKNVYASGNFVLTMSEGYPNAETGLSTAYFDLFRVENGKIAGALGYATSNSGAVRMGKCKW